MVFLTSGVQVSQDFTDRWAAATKNDSVHGLKVSIQDGLLVSVEVFDFSDSGADQWSNISKSLQDKAPTYLLIRLNNEEWLVVAYIPTEAQNRAKALYASSRIPFLHALGPSHVVDIYYATSKADLSEPVYLARRDRRLAPIPSSAADACEYQGRVASATLASARCKGLAWSAEAEEAVTALADGIQGKIVVLALDYSAELVLLRSSQECTIEQLASTIPVSEPCYAFFAWPRTPARREIVLIYSCPDSTAVKQRMLYSTNAGALLRVARQIPALAPGSASNGNSEGNRQKVVLMLRRVETADPRELDEVYLKSALELDEESGTQAPLAGMDEGAFY